MNTILWVLQILVAVTFLYSGINKSLFSEQKLVASGQTGVEGLPVPLIRFIGISEILGVAGIILPRLLNVLPFLTTVSAICFATIMVLAANIHFRKGEYKNVLINCMLFLTCVFFACSLGFQGS